LGVEKRMFYLNAALAAITGVGLHVWWLLAVNVVVHLFLMWVTASNPDIIRVYIKYRRQGDYYRPWGEPMVCNRRPEGYGRGMGG
jgi:type IV secretory pathway TrbD component